MVFSTVFTIPNDTFVFGNRDRGLFINLSCQTRVSHVEGKVKIPSAVNLQTLLGTETNHREH
jgi:hypothetical protein